jgi:hypothetical protein
MGWLLLALEFALFSHMVAWAARMGLVWLRYGVRGGAHLLCSDWLRCWEPFQPTLGLLSDACDR